MVLSNIMVYVLVLSPDGIRIKKNQNYLMIDIGRGDQENFEKKNCGQSPQKIRNKSAKSGFTG